MGAAGLFAASGPGDRHFVLDLARGEVELGPSTPLSRTAAGGRWSGSSRGDRIFASAATVTAAGARET